jgi:hypothetical protein
MHFGITTGTAVFQMSAVGMQISLRNCLLACMTRAAARNYTGEVAVEQCFNITCDTTVA